MKKEKYKFLVLGAGPTGLGAAHRLQELGETDFLVIEKDTKVGGLAKSETDSRGFTWDIGGHVHFSSFEYYNDLLDRLFPKEQWNQHKRQSWIWMEKSFIPYPLQKNIHFLPQEKLDRCLAGLRNRRSTQTPPQNFSEWGTQNLGSGIYDVFFEPYNKKVWGYDLKELNSAWISERVAPVSLPEIENSISKKSQDVDWGPNNFFRYPTHGGSGALWQRLADTLNENKIRLGTKISKIDYRQKTATVSGVEISYDYLVSTAPLVSALDIIEDVPNEIVNQKKLFKYSTTLIIGLGFLGPTPMQLKNRNWIYFPEKRFPFFRGTLLSSYSVNMVPDPENSWSFLIEITLLPDTEYDKEKLLSDSLTSLHLEGLIDNPSALISTWVYEAKFGYPTPFLERDNVLPHVQEFLENNQIFSRGRFGGWKYEVSNQDHSFMQGKEIIDKLVLGHPERVYQWRKSV
jgi:protoporphyrinogen oxidase